MSNYLYLIRCGEQVKIGVAANVFDRLSQLQTGNPVALELLNAFEFNNADSVERALHQCFYEKRGLGEWFLLSNADVAKAVIICEYLGGKIFDSVNTFANKDEVEIADDLAGYGEQEKDYDDMIADGWRIETARRTNGAIYWCWRRGSKSERESVAGGTLATLPKEHKLTERYRV